MKIESIHSIKNGMIFEQNGSGNTINIKNEAGAIFSGTTGEEMSDFLEKLRNVTEGVEKEAVVEAEECFRNKDQQGIIAKLKMLSRKTLSIAEAIAESFVGGVLLEWLKMNGIF